MKLSSNFRFLKINARQYVIFDNFAVDVHIVSASIFKCLVDKDFMNISGSLVKILIEKRILFSSKKDEVSFLKDKFNYISERMESVNSLYLSFTQQCNLNCNHCTFPKRKPAIEDIDNLKIINMIESWISFIFENKSSCEEDIWIIPYGGDPLLRKDLLFSCLEHIKQMKLVSRLYNNVKVYLPTNADLMSFDDLHFLAQYPFVHIAFGLDGDKNIHCKSKNVSGAQFDLLCEKIMLSGSLGIDFSVSTIGNIELFDSFDDFLILIRNLGVKKLAINFIRNTKVDNKKYLKALNTVYDKHYQELKDIEFQLKKRISIVEDKISFRIDCPCYGKQFTLFPNSTVGVCPFEKEGIVDLDTFLSMSYADKVKIKDTNRSNYYDLSVKNGFLYGGGCYWSHCQSIGNKKFDESVNKKLFSIIFKKKYHDKL